MQMSGEELQMPFSAGNDFTSELQDLSALDALQGLDIGPPAGVGAQQMDLGVGPFEAYASGPAPGAQAQQMLHMQQPMLSHYVTRGSAPAAAGPTATGAGLAPGASPASAVVHMPIASMRS